MQAAGLTPCARAYTLNTALGETLIWGSGLVAIGVLFLLYRWRRREGRMPWTPKVSTLQAVLTGLLVAAIAVALQQALIQFAQAMELPLPSRWRPDGSSVWLLAFSVVASAPLVEEFAFRA